MRLQISHNTLYAYDAPVNYSLQQVRLTPKSRHGQKIHNWRTKIDGGKKELEFTDYHNNHVVLVSILPGASQLSILSQGDVETSDTNGIIGDTGGYAPLWLFTRPTALTKPGRGCGKMIADLGDGFASPIDGLHALSEAIRSRIEYKTGITDAATTSEDALNHGVGVCQDHAHVFLTCARTMGYPARYVSGYLMINDCIDQEASHAWAEAYIRDLGWVGFDVSNGISPDEKYVRLATGLDYREAAPISGLRLGTSAESMNVTIQVQQ